MTAVLSTVTAMPSFKADIPDFDDAALNFLATRVIALLVGANPDYKTSRSLKYSQQGS